MHVLADLMDDVPAELQQQVIDALYIVLSELKYSGGWDKIRPKTSLLDKDKPVECWITWMQNYLSQAIVDCTHRTNKTKALESLRKIAGLAITCMMYNDTPLRSPADVRIEH